ncbi:MAG: glycine--tRNA ligase subunit beta [Gammaproteobacteria bacterium]|nr:glycine--tRNA ligase subunit beta [Gammaproteobacteria bacterium]
MSANRDLLIEIGTEELPPKALRRLGTAFADEIRAGLEKQSLASESCRWFATPRRLAVLIAGLAVAQRDREVVKRGPALSAAYDTGGKPTSAAQGFARSCGTGVDKLETQETDKGKWLVHRALEKGAPTTALLPEIIDAALARLPIPKRMRWGSGDTEFARPVHWTVVLFGTEVVPCAPLGVPAGRDTRGHRFHHPGSIPIPAPKDYVRLLRDKGHVLVDFDARMELVSGQVRAAAARENGIAHIGPALVEEVAALVEWPVPITGTFDNRFLELPREVLIAAMQHHQRYFPVLAGDGRALLPRFIAIANIDSPQPETIRRGNERVIRPRFADAAFFWERDRRTPLAERAPALEKVVYQNKLGTLADRTRRIARLCAFIGGELGADTAAAERAAQLAKCDLLTGMVGEFPELQGTMGRYYAQHDGVPDGIATALDEQYLPRFAGDRLPVTPTGQILAVADKLDAVLGIFAAGQPPTGEKDPFGLRRAALGCLRIIIERGLDLDLEHCLRRAAEGLPDTVNAAGTVPAAFDFMMERLRRYYLDEDTRADVFESVLVRRPTRPLDFHHRVRAVTEFTRRPEAESLAAANKRIRNILRQAGDDDTGQVDENLLKETAERELARALQRTELQVRPLLDRGDHMSALSMLAGLRAAVDAFFDKVLVMSEEEAVRRNRLALLRRLSALFLRTADISCLQQG